MGKREDETMKSYEVDGETKYIAGQFTRERDFWLKKLSGDIVKSIFPYDFAGRGKPEGKMDSIPCRFPETLVSRLIKAGSGSDSRLHMLLTAGLIQLLAKYTGSEDIIIGIPIYRQEKEGDFVNTLLTLRNRLEDGMSFKDLLTRVRQTVAEANEHLNYPVETIPYDLDMSYPGNDDFPLFDIIILLENIHDKNYIRPVRPAVIFSFTRSGENLEGVVEYRSDLYNKKTVERMTGYFTYLLRETLFNANSAIAGISILPDGEKKEILYGFNDTGAGYPKEMTVQRLFEKQAADTPDHTAVVHGAGHVSYKKLNRKANGISLLLAAKGVKVNTIVGIMGKRSIGMVTGILAILKAGGTYLPVNAKDPFDRIKFILEDSKAGILITQQHLAAPFANTLLIEELMGEAGAPDHRETFSGPGDYIYVIYTSGTTGKPKGVLVTHRNVVNYCCWAAGTYVKNQRVSFPLYTSIAFDLTVTSIFTPLITANTIVVYGGEANESLIEEVIADNQVGVVKLTPSHLKLLEDKKMQGKISAVKRFILGGEALDTRLAKKIHKNFNGNIEIYNEYGPTEATVGSMIYRYDPREDSGPSVPIGTPAHNTQIYLLDKRQEPVPVGAVGEIYISGDGIAAGYLYRPGLTAEKFIPNPFIPGKKMYRTGDLARRLENGNIVFSGRLDSQVKIRGYRVETSEIEKRLLRHDEIKEAVVIAVEDKGGDNYLCAYIVSDRDLPVSGLREYLTPHLPEYMIPLYFSRIDRIPLTVNGKLDKKTLPEPQPGLEGKYIAPTNEIERKLVTTWSEILNIDEPDLSIDLNFFDLGGHSLNATVLASRIHKEFNIKVPLTTIFDSPTISGLAQYITGAETDIFVALKPVEKKEYYPLSSAQKRVYFLQQMDKKNTAYNIPVLRVLEGTVDGDRLQDVFITLIKRHASMRTSFQLIAEKPIQRICSRFKFSVEYYESGDQKPGDIIKNFIRPFDLGHAPLLRVGLIKKEEKHILMFDMHHIITDGISMQILVRDFMALYGGGELPGLILQYKDYSQWQNSEIQKEKVKKQEEYWLREFAGSIPISDLPADDARPAVQGFAGSSLSFTIGPGDTAKLNEIASENEVTLFMVLLAVFNLFLANLGGQRDIVIGTGVEGRGHEDLRHIIGIFVNTLALRNYPTGEKTFTAFLREVKKRALEAMENQEYQFEDLVERLELDRDISRNPLFDVMFQFENIDMPEIRIPGLTLKPFAHEYRAAKFDLTLWGFEAGRELSFRMEYSTNLFNKETIEWFIVYFKEIVSSVIMQPYKKLSEIGRIDGEERNAELARFTDDLENE